MWKFWGKRLIKWEREIIERSAIINKKQREFIFKRKYKNRLEVIKKKVKNI